MAFNASQTFYVDKGLVQNAQEVGITAIDLWFKGKPNEINNGSGITAPGVTLQLVPTANGVPILDNIYRAPMARVEFSDVETSSDASEYTRFRFTNPIPVATNHEYAMVIHFDGDEDFLLWTSKQGHYLVGTTQISPGPSGQYVGNYYAEVSGVSGQASNATSTSLMASASSSNSAPVPNSAYTSVNWRPLNDTDLKFKVYVARYCFNGSSNLQIANTEIFSPSGGGIRASNGIWSYRLPALPMEYVLFDRKTSLVGTVQSGERVFQNTVYYSHYGNSTPTPVSTVAGSLLVTAPSGFNFNNLYGSATEDEEWIVIYSENHGGAGADACAVRRVVSIHANNVLQLAEPVPFTNSSARFFKSPVAVVDSIDKINHFGAVKDIVVLGDSNANATVRFVNNTILAVSVTSNGTGYKNTDVLTIGGFENVVGGVYGGYPAVGNVLTNGTGNIVAIALSNVGAGFVNVAQTTFAVTNSVGGTVSGGATFSVNVGSVIKGELLGTDGFGGRFSNTVVTNLGFGSMTPNVAITNPAGTVYTAYHRFGYYQTSYANASTGTAYYAYPNSAVTEAPLVNGVRKKIVMENPPVMPSRSNEFVILYPNGSPSMATSNSINQIPVDIGASNSSVIIFRAASNNDFCQVAAGSYSTKLTFSEYIYNNDYTGENTNQGNAWAKEITEKVNLVGDGAYAEDLVVFVTAHRPANTDIQVFAKIHNSTDAEAFDDKDWTRLEPKNVANGLFSSPTDESDMLELQFGFQAAPNTGVSLSGVVTTVLSSNTVTGSGTTLTDLAAGDLVKIYQPLFPNNYMISVVGGVTNATSLTLTDPVANAGMVGSGLKIEKINYKYQAYNNKLNQNVVRYYTKSGAAIDGFDTMQFKVVFLSSNTLVYPVVDDVRAVAVSA